MFRWWVKLTSKKQCGPFAPLFVPDRGHLPYLQLLHLATPEAENALEQTRRAAEKDRAGKYTDRLLDDINWRPHLIGAVSVHHRPRRAGIEALWSAIDRGSWVTPQLAAVGSLVDPSFVEQASRRLRELCPVASHRDLGTLDSVSQHSARGPAGTQHRSSKTAASLLALLESDHTASPDLGSNPDLAALADDDFDGSAQISTEWREKLVAWGS